MKVLATKIDDATATAVMTAAKAEALAAKRKQVSVSRWVHGAINDKLNRELNGTEQVPESPRLTEPDQADLLLGIADRLAAKMDTVEAKTDTVIDTVVRLLELITNPPTKKRPSRTSQEDADYWKRKLAETRAAQPESTAPHP